MTPNAQERRRLARELILAVVLASGLPLFGFSVATSTPERVAVALGTTALVAVLCFVPWARYRRRTGRPLSVDRYLPDR